MFIDIKKKVEENFKKMALSTLYTVTVDRDAIWDTYLGAFSEEYRQGNNCQNCRSWFRQYAGVVSINEKNEMITLFDFSTEDPEYSEAIKAVAKYIRSLSITGIFLNSFPKCGTDKNADPKLGVVWNHFSFVLPSTFVKRENEIGPLTGKAFDDAQVLKRSLNEITDESVDTVLELISQNSLYRGAEFKGMVEAFKKVKVVYNKIKNTQHKDNFCWRESTATNSAVCRIRNSSIGTLLNDLSEGKDLDKAVGAFERVVAPTNYKRPTALATPKMIEAAKKELEELGAISALNRRILSTKDLNVSNSLHVFNKTVVDTDIFSEISKATPQNPKLFAKTETIGIADFVKNVLPTAKRIQVLLENTHLSKFVTLVGPKEESAVNLFKWNNSYGWSYSGALAASAIKERVKAAGGNVDSVARVSLSWQNTDDLDLRIVDPKGHTTYYGNRGQMSPSSCVLDIDANGCDGLRSDPCENIFWKDLPRIEGTYAAIVKQFAKRETQNVGFDVEADLNGDIYTFSSHQNGSTGMKFEVLKFNYTKKNGFEIIDGKMSEGKAGAYKSTEKWGLKTGTFVTAKAITLSPNCWGEKEIGNKQYMFFLEGCEPDEKISPFFNEMLQEKFSAHRKTFEMLASKIEVEKSDDPLSGIGFSDTERETLIVKILGTFERTLKIQF